MSGYTEAHLAALREAVASGALEVTYDGKTIKYRSQPHLLRMIATIERSVSARPRVSHFQPTFERGT